AFTSPFFLFPLLLWYFCVIFFPGVFLSVPFYSQFFFQVSLSVVFSSVSLLPKRSRRRRSPPTTRSLSLRVRSGAASRCSYTRSLFLPAVQSHLKLPATPPPLLLDDLGGFNDLMPPLPPPVGLHTDAPDQYLEKVEALYSYEASKPDDLSLKEGDVVYLLLRRDDGWCEGCLRGNRGFFPGNYVQSCDKNGAPV
uniref:Osteoclast-stimulating factor 1 n=1 Tax=Gasterosteus aculeatus aculeatus TaxID=481459 RepID=A0AAQ4RUH6_GASAC